MYKIGGDPSSYSYRANILISRLLISRVYCIHTFSGSRPQPQLSAPDNSNFQPSLLLSFPPEKGQLHIFKTMIRSMAAHACALAIRRSSHLCSRSTAAVVEDRTKSEDRSRYLTGLMTAA